MKTIVMVKRDIDGAERLYQIPNGYKLPEGTKVMVEYRDGRTAATVTAKSIEVEDEIIKYFTNTPLRRVTTVITEDWLVWEVPQDAAGSPTEA